MKKLNIIFVIVVGLFFISCGANDRAATSNGKNGVLGVVYSTDSDSDEDGINDSDEVNVYHSNPDNNDSDGDGLLDIDEIRVYETNVTNPDSDGDGLNDYDEVNLYHTNPNDSDTDKDGLNDYEEVSVYHTNPDNNDTDKDGLIDGDEINVYETNLTNPDSDGDGLNDYEEVSVYHTNPDNNDSDEDGLLDRDEIKVHETNATNSDTDGDCLLDSFEILNYRTSPTNIDTDGDGVSDGIEIYSYNPKEFNLTCLSQPETLIDGYNTAPPKDGIPDKDNDIINALDPTNDSDGDGQANIRENNCSQGDPLDKDKRCPFETETLLGSELLANGYNYVPGGFDVDGDGKKEGGFWISRYQARESGVVIPSEKVSEIIGNVNQYVSKEFKVLNKNVEVLSYYERKLREQESTAGSILLFKDTDIAGEPRISSYTPLLALACLSQYTLTDNRGKKLDINITMPTMKQYIQVKMLLDADFQNGGDGRHIRNGLLATDPNVPLKTFSLIIEEFGENHKEFLRNIIELKDIRGNDAFNPSTDIKDWWDVDISKIKSFPKGATSSINIGHGTGPESDIYGVVVRGGDILDVRISVTGTESDGNGDTKGISFRAATPYLY